MEDRELDEILGITRCARCGHRLEGDVECPFCSLFPDRVRKERVPKWIFLTACFLTSPFSLYFILRSARLSKIEKIIAFSGCFLWMGIFQVLFISL